MLGGFTLKRDKLRELFKFVKKIKKHLLLESMLINYSKRRNTLKQQNTIQKVKKLSKK
jgi:hypothetical protein